MGKQRYLRTFITWRLILAAFIPILIVSFLVYAYLIQKTTESIEIKNELLAKSFAGEVRGILREPFIILNQITAFISSHKHQESEINSTLDISARHFTQFDYIYLLDKNGTVTNAGLPEKYTTKKDELIGSDFSNQKFFKKIKRSGQPVWSDIFLSTITGQVSLTLSLPFNDKTLIGNFSIEKLRDLTKRTESGEEISTSIVDQKGTLIFHSDKILVEQHLNMRNIAPVHEALEGRMGTYNYVLEEISFIGSTAIIPETGWLVLVSQQTDHAYASVYRVRNYFMTGLIISVFLVVFLSILISNSLIRPISQLGTSSRAIASGKYNEPIPTFDHLELEDLAGSFRNMITAVKDREYQLQKSKESYELLIETMNEGVMVIDTEARISYANPKTPAMLGYSHDEMIGSHVKDYFDSTNRKILEGQLSLRKKGLHKPYEIEWTRKDKDKIITIMSPQPLYDDEGHYNGSFAVITDITERRKTEVAIKESEEKYRTLFERESDAIFIYDPDTTNILDANKATSKMYGYDKDELIGMSCLNLSAEAEESASAIYRIREYDEVKVPYRLHRKKDGTVFFVDISSYTITLGGKKVMYAVSKDITERKSIEEELEKHHEHLEELVTERTSMLDERTENLNKSEKALRFLLEDVNDIRGDLVIANKKLKELDHLKSMFIASMSHELRTPLNSIIGFTGIILKGIAGEINEEQKDHLERVYRSGQHLLNLITDIIDISKIEAGKMEASVEAFQLDLLIYDAADSLKPQIDKKGLGINITVPPDIQINSDRKRLLQCILNFLSNAVKFTEKGEIVVTVNENNGMIIIKVKDTGIGMKDEDMNKLFGSFVRLDSHLKTVAPGTGLGLYLTKKIASEILGGTVYAESIFGQGSIFTIEVPRKL